MNGADVILDVASGPQAGEESLLSWHGTLSGLEILPAQDPRWDSVDVFVKRVRELAERKINERKFALELEMRITQLSAHRKRPKSTILPVVSNLDIALWSQLDDVSKKLVKLIDQRAAKEAQIEVTAAEDEAALFEELRVLAGEILDCWNRLARLGAPSAPEDGTLESAGCEAAQLHGALIAAPQLEVEYNQGIKERTGVPELIPISDGVEQNETSANTSVVLPVENDAPVTSPVGDEEVIVPPELPNEPVVESEPSLPAAIATDPLAGTAEVAVVKEPALQITIPLTLKEAASEVLQLPSDLERRNRLLGFLVADGYWAEAYWLAFSLTMDPAVPEDVKPKASAKETLLHALLAVLSIPASRTVAVEVLHRIIYEVQANEERALAFMIAITGYAPSSARCLKAWLEYYPLSSPTLAEISLYLQRLHLEVPVSPEAIRVCSTLESNQKILDATKSRLKEWHDNPPVHKDWRVWTKLTRQDQRPLWKMVDETLKPKSHLSAEHVTYVQRLRESGHAEGLVDDFDNSGYGKMHTSMLRNLLREITDLADVCHEYMTKTGEVEADMHALTPELVKLAEFRNFLRERNEKVIVEIGRLIDESAELGLRAAWKAGFRLWQRLAEILQISSAAEGAAALGKSLYEHRNAPLSRYPIHRDDTGAIETLVLQNSQTVASVFARELIQPLDTKILIDRIAAAGDFRFLADLRTLQIPGIDWDLASSELEKRLAESRKRLAEDRARMEVSVTRASALGFLSESRRSQYESVLSEIKQQQQSLLMLGPACRELSDILTELSRLERTWSESLSGQLDCHIEQLRLRGVSEDAVRTLDTCRVIITRKNWDAASRNFALADLVETAQQASNLETIEEIEKRLAALTVTHLAPAHLASFRFGPRNCSSNWLQIWNGLETTVTGGYPDSASKSGRS